MRLGDPIGFRCERGLAANVAERATFFGGPIFRASVDALPVSLSTMKLSPFSPSPARPRRVRTTVQRLQQSLLVITSIALLLGCSGKDRPPGTDLGSPGISSGPCSEGTQRACGVTLEQANGVLSCYRGVQKCQEGFWTGCAEGVITKEQDPTFVRQQSLQLEALSVPAACASNPCDPTCMFFDENPPNTAPIVPDWSFPAGTATCSHQLCIEGAALSASCHPCVATVCAEDATCCSTAWTADCVDLVFSECSGSTPPPPPLSLCDYGAFGDTSVRFGNGTSGRPVIGSNGSVTPEPVANLGGIVARGLVDLRNGTNVEGNVVTTGGVRAEGGAVITGDIQAGATVDLRNNALITGDVTTAGSISTETGADITGSAWAGTTIYLSTGSDIFGDARAAGNIDGQSGSRIHQDATVNAPSTVSPNVAVDGTRTSGAVSAPSAPTIELPTVQDYRRDLSSSCAVAATRPDFGNTSDPVLPPGIYGDVNVGSGHTLTLQTGGSYIFNSIRINGSGGVRLGGSPRWDISTCGAYEADGSVTVYLAGTATTPNPTDLLVYSAVTSGTGISLGDGYPTNGIFLAPDSTVRVFNGTTGTGALWGKDVYTNSGTSLFPIPSAECRAQNLFGSATCDGVTPYYANGYAYIIGNRVHYGGTIYQCTGSQCATAGDAYWPGQGTSWQSTWAAVGTCPPPPTETNACPISLEVPEMRPPRSACASGLDCQVNSRCSDVLTDPSCAHSKCEAGAALNDGCDDCVSLICADTPSCCTGAWTSDCVEMVATICDAGCGSGGAGVCEPNGTNYQSPAGACPDADLAVDINCTDNTIPVCNHGSTDVPADEAELVFFPRSGQQFATTNPDLSWAAGTCLVTSAIPAGGCVEQACSAALLDEDFTVQVRLTGSASIDECSDLDNWGYYAEGYSCPVGAVSQEQEYVATCSDPDTSPRWGLLTWNSETPANSKIRFEGRVAPTAAGLASASYLELGVAASTPADTQVCSVFSGLADCPVDLTAALYAASPANQSPHLQLRITVEPDGVNQPSLSDWQLYYSCVFDQ